jgi:hypothetical protein
MVGVVFSKQVIAVLRHGFTAKRTNHGYGVGL